MKKIIFLILFSFIGLMLQAHGPKKHEKNNDEVKQDTSKSDTLKNNGDVGKITKEDIKLIVKKDRNLTADFKDFPTLHPLVVHFPIVLIIVAAFIQLGAVFFYKKELSFVTLLLLTFGFIGAYVASTFVHPHTTDLDEFTAQVLATHETYANLTLGFSGIALALKLFSHFLFKRKLISEIAVAIALLGAAYFVSMSAHHGSQLVHIEGVGPQGKYLEMPDHQNMHNH